MTVLVPPTAGAVSCPGLYEWKVTAFRTNVWESENYNELETSLRQGVHVRGHGNKRPNGWTPVVVYKKDNGDWESLLEGTNDTNDFIRSSTLQLFGCV